MKKNYLLAVAVLLPLLISCQLLEKESYQSFFHEDQEPVLKTPRSMEASLEIWTPEDIVSDTLHRFKNRYQNVEFKVEVYDRLDLVDRYYQAILLGEQPDIMIIPANDIGAFSGIDGFEILNQEPYFDQGFFNRRPESLLDNYLNDQGEMYGFPVHF